MDNTMITAVCRACMDTKTTKFVTIDNNDSLQLYEFCIDIKVMDIKGSSVFCVKCSNTIKKFADFKKTCLKSETFWKSISENVSPGSTHELHQTAKELSYGVSRVKNEFQIISEHENQHYSDEETIKEEWPKLKLNVKSNSETFKGQCDMCSKIYTKKPFLVRHIKKCIKGLKQEELKKYCCCLCTEQYESKELMAEHLNAHFLREELKCMVCGFVGADFAVMIHHRFEHLPPARKQFGSLLCICRKRLVTALSAEYHFRKTHLQKKGGRCRICGKEYVSLKKWRKHEMLHDQRRLFHTCDICQKRFVFKSELSSHLGVHGAAGYICDVCGLGFTREHNMTMHRRRVHEQPVWEKCHHCDKSFKGKMYLAKHLSLVAGEKTVKCSYCTKMFMTERLMMQHRVMHLDLKPYKCEYCDKKFKYKSSYTAHNKSHTGARKHKCSVCQKELASSGSLRRHARAHQKWDRAHQKRDRGHDTPTVAPETAHSAH